MHLSSKIRRSIVSVAASLALAAGLSVGTSSALGQVGTSVTYQGQLKNNGIAVNSPSDIKFSIFDAETGGAQIGTISTRIGVPVSQGLFSTTFDCGVNPYTADAARWLQIEVRNPSNTGAFVQLGARQRLTAAPFSAATRGLNVDAAGNVDMGSFGHGDLFLSLRSAGGNQFRNGLRLRQYNENQGFDIVNDERGGSLGLNFIRYFGLAPDEMSDSVLFLDKLSGNIGVGTTTPFNRFDVPAGSTIGTSSMIGVTNDPANQGVKVAFGYHTPADGCGPDIFRGMRVEVVPGTAFCGNSTDLSFWTDECNVSCPREVMRINGSGNVGIGAPAPGAFDFFRLDVGGNIRCVNLTETSSREFKQDIVPLSGALDSIMKLKGVTYAWNDKAPAPVRGNHDIGFIADEMNEVLPDLVAKDASGKPVGINYSKVTPVAVEAIKQLKAEGDKKDAQIADLKARLEKIEALIAAKTVNTTK